MRLRNEKEMCWISFCFLVLCHWAALRTKETHFTAAELKKASKRLLRKSTDTGCYLLDLASVRLVVSSGLVLPFWRAFEGSSETSVSYLLRPLHCLLLRRWFPLRSLHSLLSPAFAHTFYLRKNTHTCVPCCCSQIVLDNSWK